MLAHPVELSLGRALRLSAASRLALVGAGGKTSALFQAARSLPKPVLLTTTTHLAVEQALAADRHVIAGENTDWNFLETPLPQVLLVTGPADEKGRLGNPGAAVLARLKAAADQWGAPLLIEADGARRLPVKAPSDGEPVIPDFVNQVVVLAGLSALGQALDEKHVFRPERFAALSGLQPGQPLSQDGLVRCLLHSQGGLKDIPAQARRTVLLNQADTPELQSQALALGRRLLPAYDQVVTASLGSPGGERRVYVVLERCAGILLAAGGAQRFGRAKQLLAWQGEPFVRVAARSAVSAGLDPVLVVSGAYAEEVQAALAGLPVQVVHNPDWQQGQASSVRCGVGALPAGCGAAIFLLADQPQTTVSLLRALQELHAASLAPVIAPLVQGERANPVLFDRDVFPALAELQGDTGGRALFGRYPPLWLPWLDARQILDVDSAEDYQRLLDSGV